MEGVPFAYQGVRFTGLPTPKCMKEGCENDATWMRRIPYLDLGRRCWTEMHVWYCDEHGSKAERTVFDVMMEEENSE